eukprot:gene19432-23233_t
MEAELFLAEQGDDADVAAPSALVSRSQSLIADGGAQWPAGKRDQLTQNIVYWLCKRCRPLSLPERDTELVDDVLKFASNGAYITPSKHNVVRNLCVLSGKALAVDRSKVKKLLAEGVSPSTGSTCRDFQLNLTDRKVIEQSIPVLKPVYEYTRIIQGTSYVTRVFDTADDCLVDRV